MKLLIGILFIIMVGICSGCGNKGDSVDFPIHIPKGGVVYGLGAAM